MVAACQPGAPSSFPSHPGLCPAEADKRRVGREPLWHADACRAFKGRATPTGVGGCGRHALHGGCFGVEHGLPPSASSRRSMIIRWRRRRRRRGWSRRRADWRAAGVSEREGREGGERGGRATGALALRGPIQASSAPTDVAASHQHVSRTWVGTDVVCGAAKPRWRHGDGLWPTSPCGGPNAGEFNWNNQRALVSG